MKKIETIWHHLLLIAITDKKFKHTQQELAGLFGYSTSTVNYALRIPAQIGAIRKESKFFVLENFQKLLYYWASIRNLERDIIYRARWNGSVDEIEGLAIPECFFACYSAARRLLSEAPADYAKVYFYLPEGDLEIAKARFPCQTLGKNKAEANVFFLKASATMKKYGSITTLPQTFVDIWNLKDWYSQEFTKKLEEKINGILS